MGAIRFDRRLALAKQPLARSAEMANPPVEPSEATIEATLTLLDHPEQDAFSVLGIQAERLQLAEQRIAAGRRVPVWTDREGLDRVLSAQRAPAEELARYAERGLAFARELMMRAGPELRAILCDGTRVRGEFDEAAKDLKEVIKYLAVAITGVLISSIPAALATASGGIAAVIAIILLKRKLTTFCATPAVADWLK
jgi:hypothetical protein